jgi:uncharacterized protein (TIRG00374 family)
MYGTKKNSDYFSIKTNLKKLLIPVLVGASIILIIFFLIGIKNIIKVFLNIDLLIVLGGLSLTITVVIIKAIRWKILCDSTDIPISFCNSTSYTLIGFYAGIIAKPMGDFAQGFLINKDFNYSFSRTSLSVILIRLFDIFILLGLGFFSIIYLFIIKDLREVLPAFMIIILILTISLAFMSFFLFKKIGEKVIKYLTKLFLKLFSTISNKKIEIEEFVDDFFQGITKIKEKPKSFLYILIFSLLVWSISCFQGFIFLTAVGFAIEILEIIIVISLSVIVSLVPISIGGLGTRESALIILFSILSIAEPSIATSFGLVYAICTFWIPAIIGGFVFLFRKQFIENISE